MTITEATAIYAEYPRKIGKLDATRAINQAYRLLLKDKRFRGADPSCVVNFLIDRVTAYAAAVDGQDKKFIPYMGTWMRRGSYDDDPTEWNPQPAATPLSRLLENMQ